MTSKAIESLPHSTKSKLRSTQILSSLPQLVSEILQNSLDADARNINIGVDCEGWTFWVKDDGFGISKEGLEIIGRGDDFGRYNTSKSYVASESSNTTFGFRGEALASAAEVSCVEICTRTSHSRDTWSVIVKGGDALYNGPAVRWRRESPGTVVCIRDAFYNLPVRRLSHPSPAQTWNLIRKEIETYALIFPEVTFTLENIYNGDGGNVKERIIRIPKTSSTLSSFCCIFGRELVEHVEEIDYKLGSTSIQGFISLNGAQSKAFQFLYINRHPISYCDLHRRFEANFASSSFAKNALDERGESELPLSTVRRSPRKMEKKPVFVLNLSIPADEVDNCLEPAKNNVHLQRATSVYSCLDAVVSAFLAKHGFLVETQQFEQDSQSRLLPSPRKRKRITIEDDSGYPGPEMPPFQDTCASLASRNKSIPDHESALILGDEQTSDIFWTDPTTGCRFIVDPRTGNSTLLESDDTTKSSRRTTLRGHVSVKRDTPLWLQKAMESNSAYAVSEEKIPVLPHFIPPAFHSTTPASHDYHGGIQCLQLQSLGVETNNFSREITKEHLSRAKVISQIDHKFIACLIGPLVTLEALETRCPDKASNPNGTIILVDQHAADERVRVERFLKELCLRFLRSASGGKDPVDAVEIKPVVPPRPVLLTTHEARMIKEEMGIQSIFQKWGIEFLDPPDIALDDTHLSTSSENAKSGTYMQVFVKSIPEVVSDKLLQGSELQDLIKGYIGQLQTDSHLLDNLRHTNLIWEDDLYWIKALRWCPRRLLDLVNSRACRGAIMFNDPLTIEQCERLIKQLSQSAFPFQCAHGRPSLLPLTRIDVGTGGAQRRNCDWSRFETKGTKNSNRL